MRWKMNRLGIASVLAICALLTGCNRGRPSAEPGKSREVTVYVSTDRPFAEPVLHAYEQKTGVKVNAVYDTEETKSTGLANRLLAEKNRPQADVFWSNEPIRTLMLKKNGVLAAYKSPAAEGIPAIFKDPEGDWTGFSARLRIIAYNTKLVPPSEAPQSIFDLSDPKWKNQLAMPDPRFGTASFHVAALYSVLGDQKADEFFRKLKANGVRIVDGNSVVRDMVARGEVKVGITDSDDANVPNMLSLMAGAPHSDEGKKLIDYLLSPEVERALAQSEAVQIPLHAGVAPPASLPPLSSFKPMTLDYGKAADRVEDVTRRLQTILGL
jgi:iron(III) transport system substrate-binding protein